MKLKKWLWAALLVPLLSTSYYPDMGYYPVFMSRTDLEKAVKWTTPVALVNPGKIYVKGDTLYVVEKYRGIHVIDNRNAALPVKAGFLVIPGIADLAIKNHALFADNSVDLISIDIADITKPSVIDRKREFFPEPVHPEFGYIPSEYNRYNREGNLIIVVV